MGNPNWCSKQFTSGLERQVNPNNIKEGDANVLQRGGGGRQWLGGHTMLAKKRVKGPSRESIGVSHFM